MEYYNIINSKYLSLCKSQALVMKFKIELLDHYENTIGEITSKISNAGGSINIKYNQGVRRTCDITIDNANIDYFPNNEFSPLFVNKKFKIYTGITESGLSNSDGDVFWFAQGIFIATGSSYDDKTKVLSLQGVDKFGFFTKDLNQHTLQVTYKIPVGTRLDKLISDIITLDMGNGMPTDPISPIIDSSLSNQEIPYDIEKSANETIGDILVELATAFNADIYYDVNGHLVFEPNIIDDYYRQSPVYEFTKDDTSLISSSFNYDYSSIVNQITVVGNNSDGIIYSSTAKNENPNSSLRISNIGVKASDIEETAMGYSEKRCYDYANYLLKKKMRMAASGTIECTPLPHLDCNRIVKNTIYEDDIRDVDFLVEEIQMSLGIGTYSLTVCNLQEMPVTYFTQSISNSTGSSEWVLLVDYPSLGKYANRGGETFVVAPAVVDGVSVTSIGGEDYRDVLEDDETIASSFNEGLVKGLQSVTNLYIEDGIIEIKRSAFNNTSYGKSSFNYNDIEIIRLPDTLQNIGSGAFEYCFLDKEIVVLPPSTIVESSAFHGSNIKSLVIKSDCCVGSYAFIYCCNLNDVVIEGNCELGSYCFDCCCSLENIDLGNVVTIPEHCFYNCYNLTNITIPASVMSLGKNAFIYCYGLENIIINNPICEIYDSKYTISDTATIVGYEGSTAQKYAEKYGRNFESIE